MTKFERIMLAFVALFCMFLAAWLHKNFLQYAKTRKMIEDKTHEVLNAVESYRKEISDGNT